MAELPKRRKCTGKFQKEWLKQFGGMIVPCKAGEQYARCSVCSRDIKVAASGLYDVKEHLKSRLHADNFKRHEEGGTVRAFFRPQAQCNAAKDVTRAEVLFSYFIAEHNLPASVSDHFTDLTRAMFPDSGIAKKFRCKHTKTTQIMKRSLALVSTTAVIDRCKSGSFSLMVDESNDKKSDKRLGMLVRFYDANIVRSVIRLLDMPVCNRGKAEDIFGTTDEIFDWHGIPWENCVGFASDNCNVMVGARNSVLSRVRGKQPNVFNIGCICHLANLCAAAGIKALSTPVDDLMVDIYFHFEHSSKRREDYKEFQAFTDVDDAVILKHCQTRWLSIERVVNRVLDQLPALVSYFESHDEVERPGRIRRIHERLSKPLTKMTLMFLQYVLPFLNEFNKLFQNEDLKVGVLIPEMDRLLRKLLMKFVKLCHLRDVADLRTVQFDDRAIQHDDSTIAVSLKVRNFYVDEDVTPVAQAAFANEVRGFYCAVVRKMVAKFPFGDQVLQDLAVLDPAARVNLTYEPIVRLASRFKPNLDPEQLKEEYEDFQLLEDGAFALEKDDEPRPTDQVWADILALKTPMHIIRFPLLAQLMEPLLSLPHSNADVERLFSILRKIHTEARHSLNADTITAYLQCKLNIDSCCHELPVTAEMLQLAQCATRRAVAPVPAVAVASGDESESD